MKSKIALAVIGSLSIVALSACGSPTKSVTLRNPNQVVVKLPDQVRVFCDRGNLIYAKDEGGLWGIANSPMCDGELLTGGEK